MVSAWVIGIKDLKTGRVMLHDYERDPPSSAELHVVPYTEHGDKLRFGLHDFTQHCICRPKVENGEYYVIVTHEERKPN